MDLPEVERPADLKEQLSQISFMAVKTEPTNFAGVLRVAECLKLWAEEAKKTYGPWASTFFLQSNQVVKGLRAGRPASQGLDRILRAILEADKSLALEIEKSGQPPPGTDVLVFAPESQAFPIAPTGGEDLMTVREADLPGLQDFLQEAPGHFTAIEDGLLRSNRMERWDPLQVYRPFHTLKSLFGYLGFPALGELSHQAENILEPYKRSGGKPTDAEVDRLLQALDLYRKQTALIRAGLSAGRIRRFVPPALFAPDADPVQSLTQAPAPVPSDVPGEEEKVLRIDAAGMDALMETMEEWITRLTLVRMKAQESPSFEPLEGDLDRMGKLARKLQDQMVSIRMVPIKALFARIGRVARDLSQRTGKPVRLELEGGATRLDKRLVDELWEPVLHLVRNAMDHGIESPEVRTLRGKKEPGGLWVKAWHQEGHFHISLRDNGQGLDHEKISRKARQLGWLEPGKDLEPSECQDLIFRPGFSTTDKASTVSGRGIGLDVVRRSLQGLRGSVELATVQGEGCLFILRIPLTVALLEGLLVRCGGGFFLIPLTQIDKFDLSTTDPAGKSDGEKPIPRVSLSQWLGISAEDPNHPLGIRIETPKGPVVLLVNEVLGKREVVLKGLNPLLSRLRGVNGGAILGDGRVALVLDMTRLARWGVRETAGSESQTKEGAA